MAIVKCPNCGKHTSSIETVCPHCGNQLIDELVNIPEPTPTYYNKNLTACKDCGNTISYFADYCPHCGGRQIKKKAPVNSFTIILLTIFAITGIIVNVFFISNMKEIKSIIDASYINSELELKLLSGLDESLEKYNSLSISNQNNQVNTQNPWSNTYEDESKDNGLGVNTKQPWD